MQSRPQFLLLALAALALNISPIAVRAQSFDLGSKTHVQPAANLPAAGVSILVHGHAMHVSQTSVLTPAELVAVQQVLSGGRQSLLLGVSGNAVGGSFILNSATASNFVIPSGVTAIQNAASIGTLSVDGLFANSGRYFAVSNSASVTSATIDAQNIVNTRGALLTSVLPAGGLPGIANAISRVDLNLVARDSLQNFGTVSSSGALNIASSDIRNEGLVQSLGGDINVRGFATPNISITGGGTFAASNGAINLNSGSGDIYAHFGNVIGPVNATGNYARVGANTKDLTLGAINIDGDPTFYNDGGNILINGDIHVAEALSIIASGDITTAAGVTTIQAQDATGQGYPITLIAGADVTGTSPTLQIDATTGPPYVGSATGPVSVNGPSTTGGKIDFSASTAIALKTDSTCTDCNAGNVVMAAYSSSGGASGSIDVSKASISATGNGAGTNGDVLMFAGATTGNGIQTGAINVSHTVNGAAVTNGSVSLYTTQPETSDNSPMIFETDGSVSSGNVFSPGAFPQPTLVKTGAVTAGDQFVVQTAGPVTLAALTSSGADIQSGGTVTFNGNVTVTNALHTVGSLLSMNGTANPQVIKAQSIDFSSPDRSALSLILNSAVLQSSIGTNIHATTGDLIFVTGGKISGPANFSSDTRVALGSSSTVTSSDVIEITAPVLQKPNGFIATGIQLNTTAANGAGTIVNPDGDVVLSSNLTYSGKSLAVLAAGNIVAKPNVTSIKLSSATGDGGSLTMIAGYEFEEKSGDPVDPSTDPIAGSFVLIRPSGVGGSILMPTVSVDTSSTSKDAIHNSAGEILMIGRAGGTMGLVSVNNLTATSAHGTGGYIHIIGEGGIQAGTVKNNAANGNAIRMDAAEPTIIGGDISVTDGILSGSGVFAAKTTSRTLASEVHIRGGVSTTSSVLNAGNIDIRADRDVIVDGAIDSKGHAQNSIDSSLTGGSVLLLSNLGYVNTKGITTSGVTIGNIFGDQDVSISSGHFTFAGSAGNITLLASRGVIVNGNLVANGAPASKPFNVSGYGGRITVESGNSTLSTGQTAITGYISAKAGTTSGASNFGFSGGGGTVLLQGNTVQVLGASGGVSINASYSPSIDPHFPGTITINTDTFQMLPQNFDLSSSKPSVVMYPGAAFSIGTSGTPNGAAGGLLTDPALGTVTKADVAQGYVTSTYAGKGATITILGTPPPTSPIGIDGKRVLATPAAAIEAWQNQHGQPLLSATNNVTVSEFDMPQKLTAFNIPSGVNLTMTGVSPVLTMPAKPVIAGTLEYSPSVTRGGKMMVDFGTGSGNIPVGGTIKADGNSQLIIATNAATFNNSGIISGKDVVFARTASGALTVQNIGENAGINTTHALLVSTDTSPNISYNFKSIGSTFNSAVQVGDVQYAGQWDSLALSWAKNFTKTPTVNVTFALADKDAQPITGVFGGKVDGTNISISTVPLTFNKTKVLTPLEIQFSGEFNSNNTVKVTSLGKLTLDNGATLRSAKDMTLTAPSLDAQGSVTLMAGSLKDPDSDDGSGVVALSKIQSAGGIKISITGSDGINFSGSNNFFRTTGKDLSITASGGDMKLNAANIFLANGGQLIFTAKGVITDDGIDTFTARSTDAKTNAGGGIYFGSNVTSATAGTTALKQALAMPVGTVGGVNTTGVTVDTSHGVFWQKGTGVVQLADPSLDPSVVSLNGGALVFESNGPSGNINLKAANITTYALKPIGAEYEATAEEFVVDTDI